MVAMDAEKRDRKGTEKPLLFLIPQSSAEVNSSVAENDQNVLRFCLLTFTKLLDPLKPAMRIACNINHLFPPCRAGFTLIQLHDIHLNYRCQAFVPL